MKKRIVSLLLALVTALTLLPAAAAAENTNPLLVSGLAQGQTGFLAGYNDQGRMLGLRMLTADGEVAAIPGATSLKLIRTNGGYAPQGPAFSIALQEGTVRKVNGQVRVCYDGPEGLTVSQSVTEKITGHISSFTPSTGQLNINGEKCSATKLTVEGCTFPISEDNFGHWTLSSPSTVYDFYLDIAGNICWIEQLTDDESYVCVVLSAHAQGDAIRVKLFDGRTSFVTVNQLNGKPITDVASALAQLDSLTRNKFCIFRQLAGGIGSLTLLEDAPDWQRQVDILQGTDISRHFNFTNGAISLTADGNTRFMVVTNYESRQDFNSTNVYSEIPLPRGKSVRGFAIARADNPGVADYVYLEYGEFIRHPYTPCFISNNSWWHDSSDPEDVFHILAVGTNGHHEPMLVSCGMKEAIAQDSMEIGKYSDNTYVGKLCVITAQCADGTVQSLEPTEVYPLLSLENGTITTQDGTWIYDGFTRFVWVDMGWIDENGDNVRGSTDLVTYITSFLYKYTLDYPAESCERLGLSVAVLSEEGTTDFADYVYIISGLR